MPIQILMPALSPTMTEGNLVKWHKAQGDLVKVGDILAEIETDKATMEVEAIDAGMVGAILVAEGTEAVPVNKLIAVLLEEGEGEAELQATLKGAQGAAPPPLKETPKATSSGPQTQDTLSPRAPLASQDDKAEDGRIFASPLARRIASQNNLDLQEVQGSGRRDRVIKRDVVAALAHPAAQKICMNQDSVFSGYEPSFHEAPLSSMRKIIARRLVESKQSVPHFYLSVSVVLDTLLVARQGLNHNRDSKISINDMVIQATAVALKSFPQMNVAWAGDTVRLFESVDIAVAVSLEEGLITPVIRSADTKGLAQISSEMKDLAARARAGKLKPEEFQGGTFSISNLGMFGVEEFSAIINPPQAAILAVGAGIPKPIVKEGRIESATCMNLTLSLDHRAVDGALGAQFLSLLKSLLEEPTRMLL